MSRLVILLRMLYIDEDVNVSVDVVEDENGDVDIDVDVGRLGILSL
jgi:hypothetical protein